MDLEKYERWYNNLPDAEKDLPYFKDVTGKLVSPKQRLTTERYKLKKSPLFKTSQLSNDLTETDENDIVKQRTAILVKNARKNNKPILVFGITGYTPVSISDMSNEIDNNTAVALEWKKIQLRTMRRYLKKLEE